jgi:hypothetical protein
MPSTVAMLLCGALVADNPQPGCDGRTICRPDGPVKVFRHHPGIIDSKENMQAKKDDERTIMQALRTNRISYTYCGGLGRGYTLEIQSRDLEQWQEMIDELIATGKLRYYKRTLVEYHGYGLLPLED